MANLCLDPLIVDYSRLLLELYHYLEIRQKLIRIEKEMKVSLVSEKLAEIGINA